MGIMRTANRTRTATSRRATGARIGAVLGAAGLILGGVVMGAAPASAASLTCGKITLDQGNDRLLQGCSGKGTVQYTVDCPIGQDYTFTYKWNTAGENHVFNYHCGFGTSPYSATYKIIG